MFEKIISYFRKKVKQYSLDVVKLRLRPKDLLKVDFVQELYTLVFSI